MSLGPHSTEFSNLCKPLLEFVERVVAGDSSMKRAELLESISSVFALSYSTTATQERLYAETRQLLEDHVQKLYTSISSCGDESFLLLYQHHWQKYSTGSSHLDRIYGHLNTYYVNTRFWGTSIFNYGNFSDEQQLKSIGDLALYTWKQRLIEPLKGSLVKLLLEKIHADRNGDTVNGPIIHAVIHSLVDVESYKGCKIKLYEELFETPFLKATGEHYRSEALKLLDLNRSQYVTKVINRLEDEGLRACKFLHPNSYDKVIKECKQRMVVDHLESINGECTNMVTTEWRQNLQHMYILLSPIENGLDTLIKEVELHIKQIGQTAVEQLTDDSTIPTQFVEAMLEVHSKYTVLINNVFNADKRFLEALDRSIKAVINLKNGPEAVCKAPEWFALYCDKLLKKSTKGKSDTEIDNGLSRFITVLKYLNDLDLYEQFYCKLLAKRLIHGLSRSMDAEEAMISRLQQTCRNAFIHKMHRMFTDLRASSDIKRKFKNSNKETVCDLCLSFSIHVLQARAWPFSQNLPTFAIPQQLKKSISQFEMFYDQQHKSRRLTWMHTLSTAEVKLLYLQKPYFVTMSAFQMAVLLPYESQDTLTVKELQATTQLPEKELLKQIQSLVNLKILRTGTTLSNNESTSFSLNMDYFNKRTKFNITGVVHKETQPDVEKTHRPVDGDRKIYLQLIIVRIMKYRDNLTHDLLVQEVFIQSRSRFVPSVVMIKTCIEDLLQRGYIKRSRRNRRNNAEYTYIA